ncbi:hypothetical protein FS749_007858 [Ceratobasidium sp. UAMH 11750]|nr:hypothetical protein FS749_007858 [Ceratobasidium sp. UAMH 11750]
MNFASYMFKPNKLPTVHVSQYTSANRQMSLPSKADDDPTVTIPWLLNPEWRTSYNSEAIRMRASQPPGEAIKSIHEDFQYLQSEFFCPHSLEFEDGEPIMDGDYVQILAFKRECSALLEELRGLGVPKQYRDQCSREISTISTAVQELDSWVEEQRALALAEEGQMARERAEQDKIKLEQNSRGLGPTVLRYVSSIFSSPA